MQVKKFRQPTVREALRAVREDLGADALVVSTDMVTARGWRGWMGRREVQVTAALPEERAKPSRPAAPPRRPADRSGPRDSAVARLLASGLERELAESAVSRIAPSDMRGASMRELERGLTHQLETLTVGDEPFARVEVFIGPPGVGKTTTVAKIAAQERARHGRPPGLIGADAFRAGAVEQLRTLASIIGAPFRVARTLEELDEAMSGGRTPLLVDTAGRSPRDGGIRELRRLLGNRRGVRTHLVLAGDTSAASARRILDAYDDVQPDRLVISKVDEAESLSPLLGVLSERRIPVSYITTGQRVPEDLERATPATLARALIHDGGQWAAAS
jgi:flagellar biosynthesis protein FlhF